MPFNGNQRGFKNSRLQVVNRHQPVNPVSGVGARDDLLASVVAAGAHVVAQMGFSGRRFHRKGWIRQGIMRPAHVTSRWRLLVLLNCHVITPIK